MPIAELNGVVYVAAWLSLGPADDSTLHSSTLLRLDAATGNLLSTTTLMYAPSRNYSHVGDVLTGAYGANGRVYLPTGANTVYVLKAR